MMGILKTLLFLIPIFLFSEDSWTFWGLSEAIDRFKCEQHSMETTIKTQQLASISTTYPILAERGVLAEYVHQRLEYDAKNWFDCIVQEERNSEEIWDEDYGVSYVISPVPKIPKL